MKKSLVMIGLIVLTMIVYLAGFYYSIQFDSVVAATWGLVYMILSVASVLTWLVIFIYSDSKNKLPWLFIIALFPVIGIIFVRHFGIVVD